MSLLLGCLAKVKPTSDCVGLIYGLCKPTRGSFRLLQRTGRGLHHGKAVLSSSALLNARLHVLLGATEGGENVGALAIFWRLSWRSVAFNAPHPPAAGAAGRSCGPRPWESLRSKRMPLSDSRDNGPTKGRSIRIDPIGAAYANRRSTKASLHKAMKLRSRSLIASSQLG
jgi:hypothetical protein